MAITSYQILKKIHYCHYKHQDVTINNLPSCFLQVKKLNITCVLHAHDNIITVRI